MTDDVLGAARTALREVADELVALVRGVPDPTVVAVGDWTVGDVAAHLSHVFRFDGDALAGRPVPPATVTAAGMGEVNATLLAEDGERDPAALAERIGALAAEVDAAAARCRASDLAWLQDTRLAPSAVVCHLLEECLIHGHDVARAVGRPWPIRRDHALLAIEHGVLPMLDALPPGALVDGGSSLRARVELHLRGGGRTVMALDRGTLTLHAPDGRGVDAHLCAAPEAFVLVFIGRQSIVTPVLTGQLVAWGLRPWKLAGMLAALSPP